MARLDGNGLKHFLVRLKELFLTKDSDNIKSIESKLEGVNKAADDAKVIKNIIADTVPIKPTSDGGITIEKGFGVKIGAGKYEFTIGVDTNEIATKESVDSLKERTDAIEVNQNEDLAKITEVQGKLNGIDNVQDFVNSSIATSTAEFKGTHNSLEELQIISADANDYGFVVGKDAEGNTVYNRYKYVEGQGWVFEYALNNSSFTAAQWAAIQSGITKADVEKLRNETATKNELDVVEMLAESVNNGLGETIQRVETLEEGLQADKENLKNFKQHVEADFVKDSDFNKDKEALATEIMKKGNKTWVEERISSTLNSSPAIVEAVTELKNKLQDDNDVAVSVEKQIAEAKRAVFDDLWDSATGPYGGSNAKPSKNKQENA